MQWKPIESAPKDGTWIVAITPESIEDGRPSPFVFTTRWIETKVAYWEQEDADTQKRVIKDESHWADYESPTHWMPLPDPPTDEFITLPRMEME